MATKKKKSSSNKKVGKTSKPQQEEKEQQEQKEEVDYGATADELFQRFNDSDEEKAVVAKDEGEDNVDENDSDEDEEHSKNDNNDEHVEEEDDDEDDDNDDDEEEEEEEENEEKVREEEAESEEDEEDDNREAANAVAANAGDEACSFDLRNLTAVNSHPLQESLLYKRKMNKQEVTSEKLTIGGDVKRPNDINEDYLLEKATEGAAQLIEALWLLPRERSDAGPLMTLPSYSVLEIPRALPPPPPKVESKWEKFAKERGIALNKEKRSRKVWDEATNSWKFRHGYDKANSTEGDGGGSSHKWPIMEVGANDDPYADPWEKQRDAKYERAEKNREKQLKNQERAGLLAKGTTNRIIKSRETTRKTGKAGGQKDNNALLPVGVPVDLQGNTLRGKPSLTAALKATQSSTASLGRFDKMREGEPERKFPQSKKKRKYVADTTSAGVGEQDRASKVLQQVLVSGGMEKEKARKKGKLAKGVTANDYEYDDGSSKALFSKKKGRGGIGKNKKMTKKRIK